jgi:hypothetical protein
MHVEVLGSSQMAEHEGRQDRRIVPHYDRRVMTIADLGIAKLHNDALAGSDKAEQGV